MKTLLIIASSFIAFNCVAQEQPDLQKLGRPYKFQKKQLPTDTIVLPKYKLVMPNAMTVDLGKAQLAGNNGQGQNIYVLPVDKMPCLKPDSTFRSNMPIAGRAN